MKLSATLAIAVFINSITAQPIRAGWRWPYIGAATFCQYKQMGADHTSALKAAMADGYDTESSVESEVGVTTNGAPHLLLPPGMQHMPCPV